MYRHKIEIVGNDHLTTTYYGNDVFKDKETARHMAQSMRDILSDLRASGKIYDYKVDVIPLNC